MSEQTPQRATIHFPPKYPTLTSPPLIFFGTIEPSPDNNWATQISKTVEHLPIQILNPRRDDWDSTWREEVSFAPFKETVEWDIFHAEKAGLIVFCFKAGSLSPISLMELGMYTALYATKVVVCCEEKFYKRGHVQIVCGRFRVECVDSLEELSRMVKGRMEDLCSLEKAAS